MFGFLKGTVCLPLLGGSLQFHLIRIRTGMTVSTHRTLISALFSHGMVHCVLGVLYTAWKLYGNMFLWTWNLGPDCKSSIFLFESCSFKPARKTHWFIFLFSIASDLVKYLSFLKETSFLPTLSGKSSDSTVSPNLDNNGYGSQQSQNTLLWPLLSWNGMVCSRNVFTKPWNYMETCFCDMEVGFWCQRLFSQCETWIVAASNLPEKVSGSFVFQTNNRFGQVFEFSERNMLPATLLLVNHLTVCFHLIRAATGMAHTLTEHFPDFFSHGMEHCVLGVLLQALKLQGKMILWTWELGTDGKTGSSPVKAGYLQPQTCQKTTLVHFSLHYNNKFCQILEFSERNRWVFPLVGIHLIVQFHLIRVKQILQSILTDQYTWYLFS